MLKIFATFLKKVAPKTFQQERFWAIFKNSALDGCCQSSGVFLSRRRGIR